MPFDWRAAEDAIRNIIISSSGYPDQRVIHLNQNGSRPSQDYIGISLSSLRPIGSDEATETTDLLQAGQEITYQVSGERESSLLIQAFSKQVSAETSARAVLSRVQTALSLPGIRQTLAVAGVVIFDRGEISYLPAILNTEFEGRALLTCRMYCRDDASEKTTYIETVELLDEDTGNVIEIDS